MAGRLADRATRSGPLRVLNNPVITALLLTALSMVVLFAVLGEESGLEDTTWRSRARTFVYMFVGATAVLGAHYYALERDLSQCYRADASDSLMDQLHSTQGLEELNATNPDYVPIDPATGQAKPREERPAAPPVTGGTPYEALNSTSELNLEPLSLNLMPAATPTP